jgi:BMFP domain-containing protein YqiC
MEQFRIDEIARRLFESVPPAFRSMQHDLETNFRAVLRSTLGKLDVVTRDEFDTQTKVLERTRAKLEELEKKVAELETLAASAPGSAESAGN